MVSILKGRARDLFQLTDGPESKTRLLLAHGAGAHSDSPFMNSIAKAVALQGIQVIRFEFPYMVKRRQDGRKRPPDPQAVLLETYRKAVEGLGGGEHLVIGGKSLGGRIASMLADELGVAGLVCLGYPFHPPGKPDSLRTAHLQGMKTPTLIIQGTRDPFGKPDEVATYRLSPAIEVHWLGDGDHGFKPRKSSPRSLDQNLGEAADQLAAFVLDRL